MTIYQRRLSNTICIILKSLMNISLISPYCLCSLRQMQRSRKKTVLWDQRLPSGSLTREPRCAWSVPVNSLWHGEGTTAGRVGRLADLVVNFSVAHSGSLCCIQVEPCHPNHSSQKPCAMTHLRGLEPTCWGWFGDWSLGFLDRCYDRPVFKLQHATC